MKPNPNTYETIVLPFNPKTWILKLCTIWLKCQNITRNESKFFRLGFPRQGHPVPPGLALINMLPSQWQWDNFPLPKHCSWEGRSEQERALWPTFQYPINLRYSAATALHKARVFLSSKQAIYRCDGSSLRNNHKSKRNSGARQKYNEC